MRLSSLIVDSAAIEAGSWVDFIPGLPGVRILARGLNNADYRKLQGRMVRDIPTVERAEGLSIAVEDQIQGRLLLDTVVLDIDGLTDDKDQPVKYSKALGEKFFLDPDYRIFRAAAQYAGSVVAERRKAAEVDEVKN